MAFVDNQTIGCSIGEVLRSPGSADVELISENTVGEVSWIANGTGIASGVNPTVRLSADGSDTTYNLLLSADENTVGCGAIVVTTGGEPGTSCAVSVNDDAVSFETNRVDGSIRWYANDIEVADGFAPTVVLPPASYDTYMSWQNSETGETTFHGCGTANVS